MEEGRTILFVDEAGFALLPMVVRTYAPCGQTPILRVPLTHDHLSVIGAISTMGVCSCRCNAKPTKDPISLAFCASGSRKISGKLLIIWDGASIHRCQVLKAFLAQGAAKRIHLELLPGYARTRAQSSGRCLEPPQAA